MDKIVKTTIGAVLIAGMAKSRLSKLRIRIYTFFFVICVGIRYNKIRQILKNRKQKLALIFATPRHILILTQSGLLMEVADILGHWAVLSIDVCDKELGLNIITALEKSRPTHPFLAPELRQPPSQQAYKAWIADIIRNCGYKTKKRLLEEMIRCDVDMLDGVITLVPSERIKPNWWRISKDQSEFVTIGSSSSPENIGKAARLALSRCT